MNTEEIISTKKIIIHSSSETFDVITGLEQFAKIHEIPVLIIQKINDTLKELLFSITEYATVKQQETPIELTLSLSATGKLIIELRYRGRPFNPFFPTNPTLKEETNLEDIGSLGLHLVRKYMDTYYYRREHQLNVVYLCKNRV